MIDYQVVGSLDQRELELTRGLAIIRKIHDEKKDGPDKNAMEITIKVLESELQSIKERSDRLLSE